MGKLYKVRRQRAYFLKKIMKGFNKKILIRPHQPDAPRSMFNNRCLTIFASSACRWARTIVIFDLKKGARTIGGLEIKII